MRPSPSLRRCHWPSSLSGRSAPSNGCPDPPLPLFDAEKVNGSGEAYQKLATGDAFLGIGSYFATATLAAMGAGDRGRLLALATGVKVMADAAISGKLTLDQWTRYRAFCFLCLVSAAATFAMVPFAVAEMRRALKA